MTRSAATTQRIVDFCDGWTVRPQNEDLAEAVRLPHDAMIGEARSPQAETGNHGAFFPGGTYVYEKLWRVPEDLAGRRVSLVFEGVYGETTVRVGGRVAARWNSGYREVEVDITSHVTPGEPAEVQVDVDNSRTPNSRWYTGSGIYRPVWLKNTASTFIPRDGLRVTTPDPKHPNEIDVHLSVVAHTPRTTALIEILDEDGAVVVSSPVPLASGQAVAQLVIPEPKLWSDLTPYLYQVRARINDESEVVDEVTDRFGLRAIEVDAERGLRINGRTVVLRGACVHHDNGVLGAATHRAAEWRRARLLKQNGFNAIRSSHNPLSRAFLDACDALGLFVMDELTDVWSQAKTRHDASHQFDDNWRADVEAMVAKDRNRPSVIMYSIGNEISETATPGGIRTAAELAGAVRALDGTRPTTVALNFMLNVMASFGRSAFDGDAQPKPERSSSSKTESKATSTLVNAVFSYIGPAMQHAARLRRADRFTRDALAEVDIAGYNYAYLRYSADRRRYPERVILGTESMPGDLPRIWQRVKTVPGVIGDFMWTGWDYLGEAGIGTPAYAPGEGGFGARYPALLAGPGAIDILGVPGAPMLLAGAVWDALDGPAIVVRPLDRPRKPRLTPWRTTDAVQSWSWPGCDGARSEIEVYAARGIDSVELILNGRSLGRRRPKEHVARFTEPYAPGVLEAVAYTRGREVSRSRLTSAGPARLRLRAEPQDDTARADGMHFIWVEVADEGGVVNALATDVVSLDIEGDAILEGFGSAAPATVERYTDSSHSLYYGRALAVVRVRDSNPVHVRAASASHGPTTLQLDGLP